MKTPLERFLKYITIETTSSEESTTSPSTASQFDLARLLVDELKELGLDDAHVDERCYVMATLPTNVVGRDVPTIGLIAHLDTSCAASGADVKAKVIEYEGGPIELDAGIVIPETDEMKTLVGKRLVVTDGTTLLGGDDKAGIAAIMAAAERLLNSDAPRATSAFASRRTRKLARGRIFDIHKFGANYAYTVDGGKAGEINGETFTADKAVVEVNGVGVHQARRKTL